MTTQNSLIIFERAALMLAEADTIQKAKELKSLALTAADWAKRKGMGEDAIQHCRSYALEAERKMGQMLADAPRPVGSDKGGRKKLDGSRRAPSNPPPTLKEIGLSKKESANAQRLAALPVQRFEEVKKGQVSRSKAMSDLRHDAPPSKPVSVPDFPKGPFRAIVIDPPWPIEKIAFERRASEKVSMDYATMTLEEIRELPIPKLADSRGCHVYLWVTHKFLPEGLRLFEAWGVRYECLLTWNKPTAQPLWWRFLTEHCLFGKIGTLPPLQKGCSVSFSAPQQKHSHKPEEFFDLVRKVSRGPRLTMFDYERKQFECWGVTH